MQHLLILHITPFTDSSLFKCCLFNAQSIVNKLAELHHVMYHDACDCICITACDCICITESWLHPSISDGVIDPKREYSIVRKDRIGTKGGGVCILVKRSFSVVPLQLDTKYAALEVTGVEFICLRPKLQLFVVYRPPYYDMEASLHLNAAPAHSTHNPFH